MPIIDMPLNELKLYKGSSPKPADFDAFWDKQIEILNTLSLEYTLEPADFQVPFADCYHLWFIGNNGARIHVKYIKPKAPQEPQPAVIKFHGYTGNSGDWTDLLKYTALGYSCFSMDVRGQGGLSEDVGGTTGPTVFGHIVTGITQGKDYLLFKDIFLDTAQLARIVMSMDTIDENRIGVTGASQGGALTVACAALEPRIKKVLPVYPFLSDYKRIWDMDLDQHAYSGIRDYLRRFDPRHEKIDEFFETLGYIDLHLLANRIKGDVLFVSTLMDNICPPSTQFAIYNNIESNKDIVIYHDYGHEYLPDLGDLEYKFMMDL